MADKVYLTPTPGSLGHHEGGEGRRTLFVSSSELDCCHRGSGILERPEVFHNELPSNSVTRSFRLG